MQKILSSIQQKHTSNQKSIAVLIDPDKVKAVDELMPIITIANENYVDYFFVGGSLITNTALPKVVQLIKENSSIPVLLFPGSNMHITSLADGLLFLSLISGRNPDLLIGQHVAAAQLIKESKLEVLPTGYLLVDGGIATSVVYMSNTAPIPANKPSIASSTAMAGEMLGHKLIYLDAGSGAITPVHADIISSVRKAISVPLIVGGGINTKERAQRALQAGADIIVMGNALEKNPNLLIEVSNSIYDFNKSLNIN